MNDDIAVIVLNWNEHGVVSKSLKRLREERAPIFVVDNGSTNPKDIKMVEELAGDPCVRVVALPENIGSSRGRNAGITAALRQTHVKYIFLLDGDILYVPGTLNAYKAALKALPEAFCCVGRHDQAQFYRDGHNGTLNLVKADASIPPTRKIEICTGFPMAWTQYGLFKRSVFEAFLFPETPPFDQPGHGYEDDWLYNLILERGWQVAHTTAPLYYHQASSGPRELAKSKTQTLEAWRKTAFEARFGPQAGWRNRLASAKIQTIAQV